ncbi:hypothetical protein EDD18DRAFT_1352786 [Armillaria luteobubalina]|uniref:Uncharacterized protein n=1 Tax=Armillaria luteobubalina TaxID=153913 RepID=A0AA39Q620_9AGAR|nr:hypothetical protein EDD18DRAFT_1352786 [Armillaria luteobubalina]
MLHSGGHIPKKYQQAVMSEKLSTTNLLNPSEEPQSRGEATNSAMDEIWDEYTMSPPQNNPPATHLIEFLSTEYRVQYYSEYELQAENVVALEYSRFSDQPRFTLQQQMFEAVQRTINELQAALTLATTLIP